MLSEVVSPAENVSICVHYILQSHGALS